MIRCKKPDGDSNFWDLDWFKIRSSKKSYWSLFHVRLVLNWYCILLKISL